MGEINYNLSILIPCWNSENYIENSINSLLNNDYKNFKIYLIAGGTDKTSQIAKKLQNANPNKIVLLEQKIPNKNKALNIALNVADGDLIVLTDK